MANPATITERSKISLTIMGPIIIGLIACLTAWWQINARLDGLEDRVTGSLERRWDKTDDLVYMLKFAQANNLIAVPHRRVSDEELESILTDLRQRSKEQ